MRWRWASLSPCPILSLASLPEKGTHIGNIGLVNSMHASAIGGFQLPGARTIGRMGESDMLVFRPCCRDLFRGMKPVRSIRDSAVRNALATEL